MTLPITEILSALYVLVALLNQFYEGRVTKSLKKMRTLSVFVIVWLLTDAFCYLFETSAFVPKFVIYVLYLFTYIMSCLGLIVFLQYCEAYLNEKTHFSKWIFRAPYAVLLLDVVLDIIKYLHGDIMVIQDGYMVTVGTVPMFVIVSYLLLLFYAPLIAFSKRKIVGMKTVWLLSAYSGPILVSVVVLFRTGADYSVVACALSSVFVATLLQKEITREQLESEARKRAEVENSEQLKNQLISQMAKTDGLFIVDCVQDTRTTIHNGSTLRNEYSDEVLYTPQIRHYIDTYVAETDRDMMRKVTETSYMLSAESEYIVRYRDIATNVQRYYEMRVVKISETEVLQCFYDKDSEIIDRMMFDVAKSRYHALYVVDLKSGIARVVKNTYNQMGGAVGNQFEYTSVVYGLGNFFEGDDREFFHRISSIAYLKERFAVEDQASYTYRSLISHDVNWVTVDEFILNRNPSGEPTLFALGFSYLDSEANDKAELMNRLNEDTKMIAGLADEYEGLYYCNIDEGLLRIYSPENKRPLDLQGIVDEAEDPFMILRRYAASELVHPNDRYLFDELDAETIRARLAHSKKISISYRRIMNGTYKWSVMDIIKYEDLDEPANSLAIGFANKDDEIRVKQILQSSYNVLSKAISPKEAVGEILSLAGEYFRADRCSVYEYDENRKYVNNTYEWCAGEVEDLLSVRHGALASAAEYWILNSSNFLSEPIMNEDEVVGYICIENPTYDVSAHEILKQMSVVVFNEILKQRQAELVMSQSTKVFADAFLNSFVAAYYVNLLDGSLIIFSRSKYIEEKYGHTDNYYESVMEYIEENVHPDDRALMQEAVRPDYIREHLKTGNYSLNMRDISQSEVRWYRFDVTRGNDADHAGLSFTDITDQLREEKEREQLEDIVKQQKHIKAFGDMINAALWSIQIDENNEVAGVYWSDESRHMLGYLDEQDFPNRLESWLNIIHSDDYDETLTVFAQSLKSRDTEQFVYNTEFRLRRKSGEYNWYSAVGRIEYIDENTRRMYGILMDISADKKLEEALTMAQSASRAKTVFLNNMSHDIRTPMNAIIGYTELATSHLEDSARVKDYLDKISRSSEHLLALVNDVLDMSRIESGKFTLDEKPDNLVSIVEYIESIIQADIDHKQHELTVDIEGLCNPDIYCDRLRLNQVLLNVISNSIKYTSEGGHILLRLRESAADAEGSARYEFLIRDDGMGMEEEYLKTIFEPFTRVKSSTVSGIPGTGLGMAITKRIVDVMQGDIRIESQPGVGTETYLTFTFRLNRIVSAKEQPVKEGTSYDFTGRKLLLVEDNEYNREIASEVLNDEGFLVDVAEDGSIAVDKIRYGASGDYDIILMDIQMPVMDGYEATKQIRALNTELSRIPILAMTANAFEEDRKYAIAAGMDEHIPKPIDMKKLREMLKRFLK